MKNIYFEKYLDSIDKISKDRMESNKAIFTLFNKTILLYIVTLLPYLVVDIKASWILLILMVILNMISIAFFIVWIKLNQQYSNINSAKFEVIQNYCEENDLMDFYLNEYSIYSKVNNNSISKYERYIFYIVLAGITFVTLLALCYTIFAWLI